MNKLADIFGFKYSNPVQARQRFADSGIFSPDLSQYEQEIQDKIIENIIENISSSRTSFYLSKDNPYAESNRQIIVHSQKMKDYILSKAVVRIKTKISSSNTRKFYQTPTILG